MYPLAEGWDGTSWTIQSTAAPGSFDDTLNGVSCTSATNCIAVGSFNVTSLIPEMAPSPLALIERYS